MNHAHTEGNLHHVLRLRGGSGRGMGGKAPKISGEGDLSLNKASPSSSTTDQSPDHTDRNRKTAASARKEITDLTTEAVADARTAMDGFTTHVSAQQRKDAKKEEAAMQKQGRHRKVQMVDEKLVLIIDKVPEGNFNGGDQLQIARELNRIAPNAIYDSPKTLPRGGIKVICADLESAEAIRNSTAWGLDAFGSREAFCHGPGDVNTKKVAFENGSIVEKHKLITAGFGSGFDNEAIQEQLRNAGWGIVKVVALTSPAHGNDPRRPNRIERLIEFETAQEADKAMKDGLVVFGLRVRSFRFAKSMPPERPCGKCLELGHSVRNCPKPQLCKACLNAGHTMGDPICPLKASEEQEVQQFKCNLCKLDHITGSQKCPEIVKVKQMKYSEAVAKRLGAEEQLKADKAREKADKAKANALNAQNAQQSKKTRTGGKPKGPNQTGNRQPQNEAPTHAIAAQTPLRPRRSGQEETDKQMVDQFKHLATKLVRAMIKLLTQLPSVKDGADAATLVAEVFNVEFGDVIDFGAAEIDGANVDDQQMEAETNTV